MDALLGEFERHHERMIVRARERRAAVALTNLVDAGRVKTSVSEDDLLGKRLPRDEFQGDTNFRTLKALLKKVDERGFERSAHQLEFHENFFKASARVMYREDWGVQKPRIMQKHGWESCPGEVLISPARRASRKLLERVIEFVNILGHKPIEFNQEQARMKCYNGEESLIRSFPCAGAARSNDASPCNH